MFLTPWSLMDTSANAGLVKLCVSSFVDNDRNRAPIDDVAHSDEIKAGGRVQWVPFAGGHDRPFVLPLALPEVDLDPPELPSLFAVTFPCWAGHGVDVLRVVASLP